MRCCDRATSLMPDEEAAIGRLGPLPKEAADSALPGRGLRPPAKTAPLQFDGMGGEFVGCFELDMNTRLPLQ